MLVCEICGSKNILCLAWVNANDNSYESDGPNELKDRWCNSCAEPVNFCDKDEFDERQNEI